MNTITKEWLQQAINDYESVRDELHFGLDDYQGNILAALRIALASLEAEPLGYIDAEYAELLKSGHIESCSVYAEQGEGCITLYIAPPAPVAVPDDVLKGFLPDAEKAEFWFEHNGKILFEGVKFNNAVFDACRAAMLQGAENAESPSSNYPVIPDGWVACSERMPEEGDDRIVFTDEIVMSGVSYSKKKGFYLQALEYDDDEPVDNVTHWMPLPAAPQQEAKNV